MGGRLFMNSVNIVKGRTSFEPKMEGGRAFPGFNTTHYSGLEVSILLGPIAASIAPETPKPISVNLF